MLGTGLRVEGCRESKICSRDTFPEAYITEHTSIRKSGFTGVSSGRTRGLGFNEGPHLMQVLYEMIRICVSVNPDPPTMHTKKLDKESQQNIVFRVHGVEFGVWNLWFKLEGLGSI